MLIKTKDENWTKNRKYSNNVDKILFLYVLRNRIYLLKEKEKEIAKRCETLKKYLFTSTYTEWKLWTKKLIFNYV